MRMKLYKKLAPYVAAVQLFGAMPCYSQDNKNTTDYLQPTAEEKANNNLKESATDYLRTAEPLKDRTIDYSKQILEKRAIPFFTIKGEDADQQEIQEGTIIYIKKSGILEKKTTSFYNLFFLEKGTTDYLQTEQEKPNDYQPTLKKEKLIYLQTFPEKLRLTPKETQVESMPTITQQSDLERLAQRYSKKPGIKSKSILKNKWFLAGLSLIGTGVCYHINQKKDDKKEEGSETSTDDGDWDQGPAHPLSIKF